MTEDDDRHGTYAGYQQHNKDGQPPCEPCRLANNKYSRLHAAALADIQRKDAAAE